MAKNDIATGISIAEGWRFFTADFSREGQKGIVMLTRDAQGTRWWHSLSEAEQETTELWATGYGQTIAEAVVDANAKIVSMVLGSEAA